MANVAVRHYFANKTTAGWLAEDDVLGRGEPGVDTDLLIMKIGDGATPWSSLPGFYPGMPGGSIAFTSATKGGDQPITSTTYVDVTGYDAPTFSGVGSFNATTGEWTCADAGDYEIFYCATVGRSDGAQNSTAYTRAVLDGSLIKGMEQSAFHQNTTDENGSYSARRTIPIAAGQVVKIQARNNGSENHRILENSFVFEVKKVG